MFHHGVLSQYSGKVQEQITDSRYTGVTEKHTKAPAGRLSTYAVR